MVTASLTPGGWMATEELGQPATEATQSQKSEAQEREGPGLGHGGVEPTTHTRRDSAHTIRRHEEVVGAGAKQKLPARELTGVDPELVKERVTITKRSGVNSGER